MQTGLGVHGGGDEGVVRKDREMNVGMAPFREDLAVPPTSVHETGMISIALIAGSSNWRMKAISSSPMVMLTGTLST